MSATNRNLTAAVEGYFSDLARTRASGGATGELSYHTPLANLLNAVGGALKPKAFCVPELADQGAGHPDFGLYAAKQVQRGRPREGQTPERGVVEVKSADDDTWLTAEGEQVSRYWNRYRLVLVTNTRDFAPRGRAGGPTDHAGEIQARRKYGGFRAAAEYPPKFRPQYGSRAGRIPHPRAFASGGHCGTEGFGVAFGFLCARRPFPCRAHRLKGRRDDGNCGNKVERAEKNCTP